jgi:hypothetical protein
LRVVRDSLAFLDQHRWDVIVCASRSYGQTYGAVQEFAATKGARLTVIRTQRVAPKAVPAAIRNIAGQISHNL